MSKNSVVLLEDRTVLIDKIKQGCTSYDSAVKKYLSCVKEMEKSLEVIAISVRQLSQGEDVEAVRAKADNFCTSVDRHLMSSSTSASGYSKSRRIVDADAPKNGTYVFSHYMNDLTTEVTAAMETLKEVIKITEKSKSKQSDLFSKYNKKCKEVDEMETKLAKKNKGIDNNEKFALKVADREKLKVQAESGDQALRKALQNMLDQRTKTLSLVVQGFQAHSSRYFTDLSKVMQT